MSVKGDADDGEGGDEAEEDGEDTCHCAQNSAHNTWKCKYYSTYRNGFDRLQSRNIALDLITWLEGPLSGNNLCEGGRGGQGHQQHVGDGQVHKKHVAGGAEGAGC